MFDWIGKYFQEKTYTNQDVLDIIYKKKSIVLESSWHLIGAKLADIDYSNVNNNKWTAELTFARAEWAIASWSREMFTQESIVKLHSPKDLEILKVACKYLSQSIEEKF